MNTWNLIRALFFLQTRSLFNALKVRIRRLKQPKYLIGAVVGLGYMYFWLGRAVLGGWRGGRLPVGLPEDSRLLIEGVVALVLFVVVTGIWVFSGSRAALQFSEAELAFLLPAPLPRRMLVRYKLLRGQLGTLISAAFLTLFTGRFGGDGRVVYHVLGWWLVLTLLNLHGIAASFTVQRLTERGMASWVRRLLALGVVVVLAAVVAIWVRALPSLPALAGDPRALAGNYAGWAELALTRGPGPWLLLPFRWAVHPWFATDAFEFFKALGPVLLLLALHYWWVERSDVAFEEASVALSEKRAQILANMRAGKRLGLEVPRKKASAPFALAPTGPPVVALMWKNLIAARITRRLVAWIVGLMVVLGLAVRLLPLPPAAPIAVCLAAALAFAAVALIGGSHTSSALRRSLGMLDILKGYPLPGWQLVLGELLGPAAFISSVQTLLAFTVVLTLPPEGGDLQFSWSVVLPAAVAAVMVVVPLNLVNAVVPSAATLLFPAWARPGRDAQQAGFEATGQRLVFGLAQIAVMFLTLAPAAGLAFGTFLLANWVAGTAFAQLVAGLIASAVLTIEAWYGVRLLGRLFEQYDASAEQ